MIKLKYTTYVKILVIIVIKILKKIYLSGPFWIFCLYVILTISYLRAQTIETSSLPTDSSRPSSSKSRFFLVYWLYIWTVSTVLNIRASYQGASSGFRLSPLGEIPAGAIIRHGGSGHEVQESWPYLGSYLSNATPWPYELSHVKNEFSLVGD